MTPEQLDRMAAGRQRAAAERRARGIERVRAFRAWLRAGSDIRTIPPIPTDADFAAANAANDARLGSNLNGAPRVDRFGAAA